MSLGQGSFVSSRTSSVRDNGNLKPGRILVVDDDQIVLESLRGLLRVDSHEVVTADSSRVALRELERTPANVLIADIRLPDGDGLTLLQETTQRWPDVPVIVISGYSTIESAVQAMKCGAFDYLAKPFRGDQVRHVVGRALEHHRQATSQRKGQLLTDDPRHLHNVVGRTHQMQRMYDLVEAVADSKATVLMHGETGTGKSLVARLVHRLSLRRERPFVEVSCGAIPETLLASELFGHTKGAFTGAMANKDGKFRAAEGGTIFLDEISCASPMLQMKLLRVLQEREFEPLGSNRTMRADVRVLLATNLDLQKEVDSGRFRQDLYYRINVVNIELPPLRERLSDIPLLAAHFLHKYTQHSSKRISGFTDETLDCMQRYHWPGNERELENCVERALVLTRNNVIAKEDLPPQLVQATESNAAVFASGSSGTLSLKAALTEPERRIILAALEANNWNRNTTAEVLGVNRSTLYKKMRKHGLDEPWSGPSSSEHR
ncbi:MAG: sigma-54 dependent transcriptional regulator [Planctomycetota bacterium]